MEGAEGGTGGVVGSEGTGKKKGGGKRTPQPHAEARLVARPHAWRGVRQNGAVVSGKRVVVGGGGRMGGGKNGTGEGEGVWWEGKNPWV